MSVTHIDNISITITLSAAPATEASFTTVLLLVDEAAGTGNGLNGARVVTYTDLAGAQSDQVAGYITTDVVAAVTAAFSQTPRPDKLMVGRVDTGGGESYPDGLAAVRLVNDNFYGVCIDKRTDTEILAMSTTVEALNKLLFIQSDDAAWKTAGYPGTLTALQGRENTAIVYHTTDAQWNDVAWACNRLAFDPDTISAPFDAGVQGVNALSPAPTATEAGHLDDNEANHGLPYGGTVFFMDPGVNANNRPLYEIVTKHWFEKRLEERIAALKTSASARGSKIVVDEGGQAQILGEIAAQFDIGVAAGHFVAGEIKVTPVAISDADRAAQRLRFTGEAQLAVGARLFNFTFNFGRDPLAA